MVLESTVGGVLGLRTVNAAPAANYFSVVASGAYTGTVTEGGIMNITLMKSVSTQIISLKGVLTDPAQPNLALNMWTASGSNSSWGFWETVMTYLVTVPANTTGSMTITVSAEDNIGRKLTINVNVTSPNIPGLDGSTPVDQELNFNGDTWIVIKKDTVQGCALLLKKNIDLNYYSRMRDPGDSTLSYQGSLLQNKFTQLYSSNAVPTVLKQNAVVPIISGELSAPTATMAGSTVKDIIFPLSLTEAANWAGISQTAGSGSPKLKTGINCWWLRSPAASVTKWWVVLCHADPTNGFFSYQIMASGTGGEAGGHNYYCRPAIWVKY